MGNCCNASHTVNLDRIIKYREINAKEDDDVNIDFVLDPKLVENHICTVSKRIESCDEKYRLPIFELLCQCGALKSFSATMYLLKQSFILFNNNIDQTKLSTDSQINLLCAGYILCNTYTLREYFNKLDINDTDNLANNAYKIKKYFSYYAHQLSNPDKKISNYFKFFIENDDDHYYDSHNYSNSVKSNKENESKLICFEMMDILRNLLFQIGIIWYFCTILDAASVYKPIPANMQYSFACKQRVYVDLVHPSRYSTIRRANDSVTGLYHAYVLFVKYLDIKLIDSSIVWNGTFLYQVFTKLELKLFLIELLINNDNDWSIMMDTHNQTAKHIAVQSKNESFIDLLDDYKGECEHIIYETIPKDGESYGSYVQVFESILTNTANVYQNTFSVGKIIHQLIFSSFERDYKFYNHSRHNYNSSINKETQFFQALFKNDGKHWWSISDDNYKRIMAYCVYKSDFDTFKYLFNTLDASKLRMLINTPMNNGFHVVDVCVSNARLDPRLIHYLIDNNNNNKGWQIDFNKTNVLTLAAICGQYSVMYKLLNNGYCNIETYSMYQLQFVQQWKKNYENRRTNVEWFAYVLPFKTPQKMSENTIKRVYRFAYPIDESELAALKFYENQLKQLRLADVHDLYFEMMNNLLFWCTESEISPCGLCCCKKCKVYKCSFSKSHKRKTEDYSNIEHRIIQPSYTDYTFSLEPNNRKLLCLGYLRNYCNDTFKYPNDIAMILLRYFDCNFGQYQCFRYLVTNHSDKLYLYPRLVAACIVHKKASFLQCLYKFGKKRMMNKSKTVTNYTVLQISGLIDAIEYQALSMVCYKCDYESLKILLPIVKNNPNFDINAVYEGPIDASSILDRTNRSAGAIKLNHLSPVALCCAGIRRHCSDVRFILRRMRRKARRKVGDVQERETLSSAKFCENGSKCIDLLSKEPNIIIEHKYFDGIEVIQNDIS